MHTFDLILSVIPAAESFFASALLVWLYFKTRTPHHGYFHVFYAFLGLFYFMSVFFYLNDYNAISVLFSFSLPITLSLFPAFYLYLRSLTGSELPSLKNQMIHFAIPIVFLLFLLPFQFLPNDIRLAYVMRSPIISTDEYPILRITRIVYRFAVTYLINIQFLVYLVFMSRELIQYRKRIEERFSFKEQINLEWAVYSIFFFAMLTILINFSHFIGVSAYIYSRIIFNTISIAIIFFLFIKGFSQRNIFIPEGRNLHEIIPHIPEYIVIEKNVAEVFPIETNNLDNPETPETIQVKPKYIHSTLTTESRNRILEDLEVLIFEASFFLRKNLDIDQLADQLKTNSTYLSQIINENYGKNFFHFVNEVRIEEAKKQLQDQQNDKYTIEAIANSCGFNSRSSFHSAFKKVTGITPAEYRNSLKR